MKVTHFKRAAAIAAALILLNEQDRGADCLKWVKREDVGSYGQRMHQAMVYDPDLKLTIFFGGEIGSEGDREYFDDTQAYDGKHWIPINFKDNVKPPTRSMHAMAYDPIHHQVVLYGGHRADERAFGDTWILTTDGLNGKWTMSDKGAGTIAGHAMVWDPVRKVVMMQGGVDRVFPPALVTIQYFGGSTWNGEAWQPDASPGGLGYGLAMAFDTNRGVALAYGGFNGRNETFVSVGSFYHEYAPGGSWVPLRSVSGARVDRRAYVAMAYDERRQRVVMVGGVGSSPEAGEEAYEYVPDQGWVPIPRLPEGQGRAGAKMVYDSARGVMVLTGGAGGGAENADDGGRYSDTWELVPTLSITKQPLSVTNDVCADAQFSVEAEGVPPFRYSWRRDGRPLVQDSEHYLGTAGPVLTIKGLRHEHTGNYDVEVKDSCGDGTVVASLAATLTVMPPSQWVFRGTNGPPARFGHGMAYDNTRGVTVLFGGQTNWNGIFPFNDLWEWDGALWTLRVADNKTNGWTNVARIGWAPSYRDRPVQRCQFAMAYDSLRGKVVVFGGRTLAPSGIDLILKDLWEWDGTTWHFGGTNGPAARYDCSMAFDASRGRTVLFGGTRVGAPDEPPGLVWEWDEAGWHPIDPGQGVGPENNFARGSSMTYDSVRTNVVLGPTTPVGRSGAWVFWDWNGAFWKQFNHLDYFSDPVLSVLGTTAYGALAFDQQLRRSVWFGGAGGNPINRTAFFDGEQWTLLTNSVANPAPRLRHAMTYDSRRKVTVLFGGSLVTAGTTGATNDTWELAAFSAPLINEHPASQYRKVGDTATFTVQAVSPGAMSYKWYHLGTNANSSWTALSTTTDMLSIEQLGPRDEGRYFVLVSSTCGETASRPAILTLDPRLHVFSSGNSTTLVWAPDPKIVLEVTNKLEGEKTVWTIVPNPPNPFNIAALGSGKFFRLRRLP